ncbi:MAG: archaellin/type IV pilin N-terminal domain-containing protein [Candidatus Aenigmatarchaeota archaeon]
MKGISTVIATLLILVITIALAGMAYVYISGVFTMQTQGIEVVDAYCVGNNVNITIRNIGTRTISANNGTCTQTAPSGDSCSSRTFPSSDLQPGNTTLITDSCTGIGARICAYRLTPPYGRTVEVSVPCY